MQTNKVEECQKSGISEHYQNLAILKLQELLETEIRKLPSDVAIALSGGLDSSILACLMKKLGIKFKAYVVGTRNSQDIRYAREQARRIGIQIEVIEVDEKEIEENVMIQKEILLKLKETNKETIVDRLRIATNLPLFFVAKYAREKNIVLGQGADELFGGYERYLKLENLEKEMKTDAETFIKTGMKQNEETGKYWNKKFLFPYYSREIMEFASKLDLKFKIDNNARKIILRKLAEKLGLNIREKKAMQYGSGIVYIMQKIWKKQGN